MTHFRVHGSVPNPGKDAGQKPEACERVGNRHLRDVDVEVCTTSPVHCRKLKMIHLLLQFLLGTVEKMPDIYLDELQDMLAASSGVQVSRATIWRTLRNAGLTMKKVSSYIYDSMY